MASRPKEPTTRAGILAAGLVRIVRTAAELTEAKAWWTTNRCKDGSAFASVGDGVPRELLSDRPPYWLKPPLTPAEQVARMFKAAEGEYRDAAKYVGGKRCKTPGEMSQAQLQAALGAIARRLRGEDASLEFEAA